MKEEQDVYAVGERPDSEAPYGFFAAPALEWRGTLRRLASAACLARGASAGVDPRWSAGAFCVGKKDG